MKGEGWLAAIDSENPSYMMPVKEGKRMLSNPCHGGCQVFCFVVSDNFAHIAALHDAAWLSRPNFDLMHFLVEQAPGLCLLSDMKGNTPFDFVRKDHWNDWVAFLRERQHLLQVRTS
jgi:hypothetical protein